MKKVLLLKGALKVKKAKHKTRQMLKRGIHSVAVLIGPKPVCPWSSCVLDVDHSNSKFHGLCRQTNATTHANTGSNF